MSGSCTINLFSIDEKRSLLFLIFILHVMFVLWLEFPNVGRFLWQIVLLSVTISLLADVSGLISGIE